jgi:hypothetical protein
VTTFPALYRQHVQPRLERECHIAGVLVGCGLEDWPGAHARVRLLALQLGGSALPGHLLDSLLDWIDGQLLREAVKAEAETDAHRTVAERVADEIEQWEATLCTTATIP